MADRVRLTISVSREVHDAYSELATKAGVSLGRAMGDWLADTVESAQFVATMVDRVKRSPRAVVEELLVRHRRDEDELFSARAMIERGQAVTFGIGRTGGLGPRAGRGASAASGTAGPGAQLADATDAEGPPCSPTGVKDRRRGTA